MLRSLSMPCSGAIPESTLLSIELELLQKLCRTGVKSVSSDDIEALARHSWVAPDHRVVFDALFRVANIPPAALRHQLPAEATRMGFPDVAWERYFEPANECEPSRTATELIAALTVRSK
ncbi:MAG TPA: hypothetical protein VMF66_06260 [Candidatus Acidoferrum sp.]|nr:hypothetical protein [Candidatus Acidoferrum sp.]